MTWNPVRSRIVASITAISVVAILLVALCPWGDVLARLCSWYDDDQLVKWVAVVVNLAVVVIALFLNTLVERLRRPRFRIDCGGGRPWQTQTKVAKAEDVTQMHLRLRITNVGRRGEAACEVRLEEVYRLHTATGRKPELIPAHDPRPLKWVGRNTRPISLNVGAFDLVDVGVRRSDHLECFRVEFAERGHLDLVLEHDVLAGFRVVGTAYGKRALPHRFAFDLSWNPRSEFGPIDIRRVK